VSDAALAKQHLSTARDYTKDGGDLLEAAGEVSKARRLIPDGHSALDLLSRASEAHTINRQRELLREAEQLLEGDVDAVRGEVDA